MECKLRIVKISRNVFNGAFVIGEVPHFNVDEYRIDPDKLATDRRMCGDTHGLIVAIKYHLTNCHHNSLLLKTAAQGISQLDLHALCRATTITNIRGV